MKIHNWGILAPGNIARSFATALNGVENAKLHSVASRNIDRAHSFAKEFNVATVAPSYAALIADPDVDIIYIATPHNLHAEQSIACLKAGKAVLCEKPMTVNLEEAQSVIATAELQQQFYMEAVWTRFLPIYRKIQAWIDEGKIGEVEMVQASFGFAIPFDEQSRIFNAELAGGCLLDMGIYPITFAQLILANSPEKNPDQVMVPSSIAALGHVGKTGVDERTGIVLKYPDGKIATLNSSLKTSTSGDAWVFGSKGNIHVPAFWSAQSATLFTGNRLPYTESDTVQCLHEVNGYEYEIIETQRCLEKGLLQSPTMSWNKSLSMMQVMDEVRRQIGLSYPFEK